MCAAIQNNDSRIVVARFQCWWFHDSAASVSRAYGRWLILRHRSGASAMPTKIFMSTMCQSPSTLRCVRESVSMKIAVVAHTRPVDCGTS